MCRGRSEENPGNKAEALCNCTEDEELFAQMKPHVRNGAHTHIWGHRIWQHTTDKSFQSFLQHGNTLLNINSRRGQTWGLMDKLTSERCPVIPQRWQCWFHRGGLSQGLKPCEGRPQMEQGRPGQSLWMWPWIPQRTQVGHFCWHDTETEKTVRMVVTII